ncbi:glycoside hydrolase family 88 protein [Bifidobacterium simiarum]|uniref:glycoside hydrolase family 88 protein n=1 Tax=Bifidobacterium simiarum TaxID=2045441 RepID=UPI001BDDB45D|nr:glycoside hydrolase family 88 protein [Bifidobacterium simiarum]MBT1166542.1 glycoside hydrolase family 88 protein [Bifidobacterium simiarum]
MTQMLTEEEHEWASSLLPKLSDKFAAERDRVGSHIPYIAEDGVYKDFKDISDPAWWTNGFWPGILWQMFQATGDEAYVKPARDVEDTLTKVIDTDFMGLHHDVGFMWLLSAVADYRLTGDERAKNRGLAAATLLAGRFNPAGRFIRAWNLPESEGWAIIDSMMNIQILFWASDVTGDPRFADVARMHADTLLKAVVRPDGSCNHIVDLDLETGELKNNPGGQGYESGSSWTRGQSWAVYGYALAARHSGQKRYLDAAKRVANYFCANVALNDDKALIDFRAPAEPVYWDALANVITACGLLEIVDQVPQLERPFYVRWAVRLLKAVDKNWCDWDPARDGLVQMCSGCYENDADREVPMMYADYYFLEAVLRLNGKAARLW